MNILLINHYAGSNIHGMEHRPFYLAREWSRLGHSVTIIAASFSHLRSKKVEMQNSVTTETIEGIKYVWMKTPAYKGNGLGRVLNMIVFSVMLYTKGKNIVKNYKPDLVIASSPHPFIIFGAYKISQFSKSQLVFEVRDLWPLTLIELGNISRKHILVRLMNWTEKFAYRKADIITSVLPKADLYMKQIGMHIDKFLYIPNGIDATEWKVVSNSLPEHHTRILSKLREKNTIIVGYAGGHGISNALDLLIEAASLIQEDDIKIVLVGNGSEKIRLEKAVVASNINNVLFLPPVPKHAMPSLLSYMDVLFIGWLCSPLYCYGISPNKLFDYMMSGKPVIHSIDAANDPVYESGCGLSIEPENPEAIAKAIIKMRNMTSHERTQMGLKGKSYVERNCDYKVLAKRYIEDAIEK